MRRTRLNCTRISGTAICTGVPASPELIFCAAIQNAPLERTIRFPLKSDEDAFLLQVLHACHHLFTQWIRISACLRSHISCTGGPPIMIYGAALSGESATTPCCREFVVIVTEMAARLFAAPVPQLIQNWNAGIRPGPRIWIEHYARDWALSGLPVYEFSLFPRSKLALFLHKQYRSASSTEKSQHQDKPPSSRLSRTALAIKREPSLLLNRAWWRRQHFFRRSVFRALAGVRYAVEIPRWRRLMRTSEQTSAAGSWPCDSLQSKKAS